MADVRGKSLGIHGFALPKKGGYGKSYLEPSHWHCRLLYLMYIHIYYIYITYIYILYIYMLQGTADRGTTIGQP